MCDENPFKQVLQNKLASVSQGANVGQPIIAKSSTSTWVIVFLVFIFILLIIILGLAIWALIVAYRARNKANTFSVSQGPQGPQGSPGAPGSPGTMGPPGPPGKFAYIGMGAMSGLYVDGCVKVPNENKLNIPVQSESFLLFDKRMPDPNGRLTDQMGTIAIGEDGVFVMYVSLDMKIHDASKPVTIRVYKNQVMIGYYEYYQNGSQSFTVTNSFQKGDQVRISAISMNENDQFVSYGSFLTILAS
jgi:hypothetical protein